LIEQFERSNSKLKEFLRHQYHLEAEHGIIYEKYETLTTHIHELETENTQIRRLLLDRENDNITLLNELERIRTHTIGFDTMKSSLENNRAHLQRELYAKEGEINRLQCALRVRSILSIEISLSSFLHSPWSVIFNAVVFKVVISIDL
jgi:chromosome segregation ATPase